MQTEIIKDRLERFGIITNNLDMRLFTFDMYKQYKKREFRAILKGMNAFKPSTWIKFTPAKKHAVMTQYKKGQEIILDLKREGVIKLTADIVKAFKENDTKIPSEVEEIFSLDKNSIDVSQYRLVDLGIDYNVIAAHFIKNKLFNVSINDIEIINNERAERNTKTYKRQIK